MLKEFGPAFKHIAGEINDAADALSRLKMEENEYNTINWEIKYPKLEYVDTLHVLCRNFNSMEFEHDESEIVHKITETQAKHFIDETYKDCKFPLDVRMFSKHQNDNETLQQDLKSASTVKDSPYTTKMVEGAELIHKHNRIWVPALLQQRVMDWYHVPC